MIEWLGVFDFRSKAFVFSSLITLVAIFSIVPLVWPGDAYEYKVEAHRAAHDSARVLVTGELVIRRPCPGSTATTWYEGADHAAEPAVRTGHLEHEMVGKSTVIMAIDKAQAVPIAMEFMPPEWARGIRWQLRLKPECAGAEKGLLEVGYVELPSR